MALMATAKASNREWVNAPPGLWNGIICDVQDLGEQENKKYNKMQHKCLLLIQLEPRMEATDQEEAEGRQGRRFLISKKFTVSLANNSELLPFIQGVLNRPLTQDEKDGGFDLESLIGVNVLCQVIHQPDENDKEKIWANIQACLPNPDPNKMQVEDYIPKAQREANNQNGAQGNGQANNNRQAPAQAQVPQQAQAPASGNTDLTREKTRYNGYKSMCQDLKIPLRELPEKILADPAKLKTVNDALLEAINKKQAEIKAAEDAAKAQQAGGAEDDDDEFDPLGGDEEDDDGDFDPLAPVDEAPAAPAPAAPAPAPAETKSTPTGTALAKGRADKKKTAAKEENPLDGEPEGHNPFDQDAAPAAAAPAAGGAQQAEDEAFAAAVSETTGMTETITKIAYSLVKKGIDITGFATNEAILEAVNAFRATTNKKPIDNMSKLTAAAASTVLARIEDGTIEVDA